MTTEPEHEREPPRRKFDDVASLFGTIVPAPGALPRPVEKPAGATLPEQTPSMPLMPLPAVAREVKPPPPPAPAPAQRPEPKPLPRQRPTELPWPDAFEPRPNYRRREPRNWSWLLLIPVGFIAAVGISTLDPSTIRSWLQANVLHRTTAPGTMDSPLLPALPSTPVPANTPAAEAPIPYPELPTSPVPVPPGAEVSPPPVNPADTAAAATAPIHIMIQYRRNIPGSDGEARRIAALLQSYGGSIELHPNATTVRNPMIMYYNAADKAAATALSTILANEAANWNVRAGTIKYPIGTLDVWLP